VLKYIRQSGATVSLDTQWDPSEKWNVDFREILPLIDIFMPNEQELMALTHMSSLGEAISAVSGLINAMVVKCGSKGSVMITRGGNSRMIPALLNDSPIDCIGAGDSFNAGFVSAFVHGESLENCQDMGNLTGAISTTAAGGTGAFSSVDSINKAASSFGKEIKLFK
jgi:sugar/nucleoside kinase (ribokinase family)